MKLAEALMKRKDLQKEISALKSDISSLTIRRKNAPQYDNINVKSKLQEFLSKYEELEKLNVSIAKTNAKYLIEDIEKIKIIDKLIAFYSALKSILLHDGSYEEVEWVANLDLEEIDVFLKMLEKQRRDVDRKLQKMNWQIDLEGQASEEL